MALRMSLFMLPYLNSFIVSASKALYMLEYFVLIWMYRLYLGIISISSESVLLHRIKCKRSTIQAHNFVLRTSLVIQSRFLGNYTNSKEWKYLEKFWQTTQISVNKCLRNSFCILYTAAVFDIPQWLYFFHACIYPNAYCSVCMVYLPSRCKDTIQF